MTQIRFLPEADRKVESLRDEFYANLRRIALRLAGHERSEKVLTRHVEMAMEALVNTGLSRIPWWKQPQQKTAIGGLLFGSSFTIDEVIAKFTACTSFNVPLFWIMLTAGLFLLVWGALGKWIN